MLGKKLAITSTEALFLMTLNISSSLSGSEVVRKLKESLGEEWSPAAGTTYKIFQSLEKKGLIQEITKELTSTDQLKDKRIRKYKLTDQGKKTIPVLTQRVQKVIMFVEDCCPEYFEDTEKKS